MDIIENLTDVSLWALDETGKHLESNNYYTWSPIGQPMVIERNGCRKGANIIGATEILNHSNFIYQAYSKEDTTICSIHVIEFLKQLLDYDTSRGIRKTLIILDNAGFHKSFEVKKFARENEDRLVLILQPKYSPQLNPQENMWNWLKTFLASSSAYSSVDELLTAIKKFQTYVNAHKAEVKQRVYGRYYYK